jgi:hypothetical protein
MVGYKARIYLASWVPDCYREAVPIQCSCKRSIYITYRLFFIFLKNHSATWAFNVASHEIRQLYSHLPFMRATWYPVPPNASSHLPNRRRKKKPSKVVCIIGDVNHLSSITNVNKETNISSLVLSLLPSLNTTFQFNNTKRYPSVH